jgi:hypothetical protein
MYEMHLALFLKAGCDINNTRTEQVVFDIVDMEYLYNAIIGRGTLNAFEAILHPAYLCMKIPSNQWPIAIHGSQEAARKAEGNWTDSKAIHNIDGAEVCEQYKYRREKVASADQPKPMLSCEDIAKQKVLLGSQLSEEQEKALTRFLFNNKDVFAWSANDLCGVNRDVIEHSLNVDPSFRPRKQRLRKMSDDKAEGARNEVKRLLSAGVIREVKYPEWLANTVMVKKANGKWRMCIDFTDLNKACPKDEFPLSRIDSLVDAAASSELMSLLDCYSGYHQIWMKKEDEPKTSFITPSGTYCYLRMPEGLKNAGGSFSRMTAKVLHSQIGRNVLTYVDDIIVKSTKQENHIADLQETFANFRQAGLKLNPEKCVFGVKKGKFLGCLVSTKGIEANPNKIEAILRMEPPSTKKGAQRLTGRLASLNRFISRSAERNLPFFEVLKVSRSFSMGISPAKSLRRAEAVSDRFNNLNSTNARGSSAAVCGSFALCSKCSACSGEAWRTIEKACSSILRLRSSQFIKEKLYRIGEGVVCHLNGLQEASTLFSSIPYNCSFITALEGYYEKQRSYWKDWKVGCGTQSSALIMCIDLRFSPRR